MARISRSMRVRFWQLIGQGVTASEAGLQVGMAIPTATRVFRESGGVNPRLRPGTLRVSMDEREEILIRDLRGEGVREIARAIGRSASTISRELRRGRDRHGQYRATAAELDAQRRARRPKSGKLQLSARLREYVQERLRQGDSPEQIAHRLRMEFPDDAEMRVSHETIYKALYVQGRGGLRRELTTCLRTGRAIRKPRQRASQDKRGKIADLVSITERPPEVADRAVPGHWEGDLIMGSTASRSAIGTLVERTTGFVMLLHLPDGHSAEQVQQAMINTMSQLPAVLRRTLTWDRGTEMRNHIQIADALDLDIYFCDPHSPWQRGTNENTNGLLRQYFPKSTDLSIYTPDYLDFIAQRLNNRPRKRHNWHTPAEVLDRLLSAKDPYVAFTA